jgi:hypothetical protein
MPVHDWTRVSAGTFHAFHNSWITHLQESLNGGVLPEDYYALGEQRSGDIGPDLLTLHTQGDCGDWRPTWQDNDSGMIAVAERPPKVSMAPEAVTDAAFYLAKRRSIAIYHCTGDRIVALIEILSPGNKHSERTVNNFLDKAAAALREGYHLLVVDLFPPGRHDPHGIHGLMWEYINDEVWQAPGELPLTLASYCAKSPIAAYVEPLCAGRTLPDMPLFLTPEHYINVPLECTYLAAWRGLPERWRRVIEANG